MAGPPLLRGVGAFARTGPGNITPGLPPGTVEGDLLIMVLETRAQTISVTDWAQAPDSPQTGGPGGAKSRLTILWVIETAVGVNRTTTGASNHKVGQIIGIQAGTFDAAAADPFDVSAGGTQTTTTAVSIPGDTTTIADCLILAAVTGHIPDADGTTEFSGWTNADLVSITERMDVALSDGDGGAMGAATGVKATAGAYAATTATAVTSASRGVISLAIAPSAAAGVTITLTAVALAVTPAALDVTIGRIVTLVAAAIAVTPAALVIGGAVAGLIRRLKHHHGPTTARQTHWRDPTD